jgi:agmatinase
MKFDDAYYGNIFMGATNDYQAAHAVIYGMPMDYTSSFRLGSRFGPKKIREMSILLEEYSPYLDRDLIEIKYFDAGDIPLPFGNAEKSIELIGDYVRRLLYDVKLPIGLGGEHLVSWPVIRELYHKYPDLIVFHFDAHADLRIDYEGEVLSHATPIRKVVELIGGENVYQFGIRSGTKDEFAYARKHINFYPDEVLVPLKKVLAQKINRPIYLTIDIDVLDPAYAPGTGTIEAGGISSLELLAAVHAILAADCQIVGADIVEVCPPYDVSDQTSAIAAKLVRELLLGVSK